MSFFNLKELPQPLLPFWGAERPLTQLLKTAFTFILSQHSLAHGGRECSAFKQKEQRKYILFFIWRYWIQKHDEVIIGFPSGAGIFGVQF